MLVVLAVIIVVAISVSYSLIKDYEGELVPYVVIFACGLVWLIGSPLVDISFGEKTYTGYIYSAEDSLNTTIGHIRFSENAGADEQPNFCAVKGSEEAKKIKELAGSGKKVVVTVPEGLVLKNWYGQCGLPATIEVTNETTK